MSDEGTVNNQMMDATTGIVTLLTGQAPSQAFGMLDAVMVETLGMAMHNAVHRQQNASLVNAAAVTAACAKMLAVPFPAPPPPPPPAGSPSPVTPLPPLNPILTTTVGTLPALQAAKGDPPAAAGAKPAGTPGKDPAAASVDAPSKDGKAQISDGTQK